MLGGALNAQLGCQIGFAVFIEEIEVGHGHGGKTAVESCQSPEGAHQVAIAIHGAIANVQAGEEFRDLVSLVPGVGRAKLVAVFVRKLLLHVRAVVDVLEIEPGLEVAVQAERVVAAVVGVEQLFHLGRGRAALRIAPIGLVGFHKRVAIDCTACGHQVARGIPGAGVNVKLAGAGSDVLHHFLENVVGRGAHDVNFNAGLALPHLLHRRCACGVGL